MSVRGRFVLFFVALTASLVANPADALIEVPTSVRPGDLFTVRVPRGDQVPASVRFRGLDYSRLADAGDGAALFLLGLDLETPTGGVEVLTIRHEAGSSEMREVRVVPRAFPEERLTLPPSMVTPPPELLERITRERELAAAVYRLSAPEQLWDSWFTPPVTVPPSGNFGRRRILNGEPRSPHSGQDYKVPAGTPVRAAAGGSVRLARDLYYSGLTVLLDHGAGLVSQYFHLESLQVAEGDPVAAGQVLGRSGSTGRVTGAHLHFGLRLREQRVDPETLWGLGPPPSP